MTNPSIFNFIFSTVVDSVVVHAEVVLGLAHIPRQSVGRVFVSVID